MDAMWVLPMQEGYDKGYGKGYGKGYAKALIDAVRNGAMKIAAAAKILEVSEDEFSQLMETVSSN